jgi:hypothetical protein
MLCSYMMNLACCSVSNQAQNTVIGSFPCQPKNHPTCVAYFPFVILNHLLFIRMHISLKSVHFNRLSAGKLAAGRKSKLFTNFKKKEKS